MSNRKSFLSVAAMLFIVLINIGPLCAQTTRNGKLTINSTSTSKDAFVFVNGEQEGNIPLELRLKPGQYSIKIVKQLYNAYDTTIQINSGKNIVITPELEIGYTETSFKVNSNADIYIDGEYVGKSFWKGLLSLGRHTVECKQEDHFNSIRIINVQIPFPGIVELDVPKMKTGKLIVNSSVHNASIYVDDNYVGVTPMEINDITVGEHAVSVVKDGYKSETYTVKVNDVDIDNIFADLKQIVNIYIKSNPSSATLKINGKNIGKTPYCDDIEAGIYTIQLDAPRHERLISETNINSANRTFHFRLRPHYMRKNEAYIRCEFQYGGLMSVGGTIGGYFKNINAELGYLYGLTDSDDIYWNTNVSEISSAIYKYKASTYFGSLGYGIVLKSRFRFTPQVGFSVVNCVVSSKEFINLTHSQDPGADKTYAASLMGGIKIEYALSSFMGVCIVPMYSVNINTGEIYQQLSAVSSIIKNYTNSFNIKAGLYFYY